MVFQVFNLIPAFTVAENIALFSSSLGPVMDPKQIADQIRETSERYDLSVDPNALVMDLSMGDQQKVEILKLLISNARILILDEPTRVLVPHEIEALFSILESLRMDGYAIILITHKMKEVMQIADRISVLRNGRVAGSLAVDQASEQKLIAMMFAKPVSEFQSAGRSPEPIEREPLLVIEQVSTKSVGSRIALAEIDLQIHAGEIVGITGVSGNGQTELADVVLGRLHPESGVITLAGEEIANLSIGAIRRRGVAFIPESPLSLAVAPYMSVLENCAVPQLWRYARKAGFAIDWDAVREDYVQSMEALEFTLALHAPARSLSGGNLQRMVIARELSHSPKLIIASYLTNGLDVRSAIAARQALIRARALGSGVLLFSDDLDELFSISDRLIVIQGGRIKGCFNPEQTTYEEIGYLMTGSVVPHVH